MSLVEHAKRELERGGLFDADSDYGGMVATAVMELIECFAAQGHSGFSAGMARSLFTTLAAFEPLGALKGTDDEWVEVGDGLFQNNRCGSVFRCASGAYNIDGLVFRDQNGCTFTNVHSRTPVQFPYTPSSKTVDVFVADED